MKSLTKHEHKRLVAISSTIILSIILSVPIMSMKYADLEKDDKSKTAVIVDLSKFSPKNLRYALKLYKIKNADIVYRQAILETGNFTSSIFKENNNLFGMKHPVIRETTSKGRNRGHAKYSTWLDSVKDMAHFQDFYQYRLQTQTYYDFLDQVYATDNLYTQKLKQLSI